MDEYLRGFNDGYHKAKETNAYETFITMDGKKLAELTYKDITELQEKEKARMRHF